MEALRADLSAHTVEGYAYRVDLRLRPYGSSGQLVFPLDSLVRLLRQDRGALGAAGPAEGAAGRRGPGSRARVPRLDARACSRPRTSRRRWRPPSTVCAARR